MFNERKNEVNTLLNEAVNKMADEAVYVTSAEDQKKIRDVLDRYFAFRQKAMEDALKFLDDDSKNAKDQTDQWRKHLLRAGSDGSKMIYDVIKDVPRKSAFIDVVARVAFLESVFFTRLAHMSLPDAMQGQLIEFRKEFEKEQESLLDKWDDLVDKDEDIDEKIEQATKSLLEVFQKELSKIDSANTKVRENLTTWLKGIHIADEIKNPGTPSLFEPVTNMMDAINQLMVSSKDLSRRFEALYKSEEALVVVVFGKTRESVKDFLEKTNLEKAIKGYTDAERQLQDIAKSMETKGMQEDALRFVSEGSKSTKSHLEDFTKAYNDFVNEFREIFIGPVGDKTVEDLVEKKRWDAARNDWMRLNIQTELKRIYDDARDWFAVDLGEQNPIIKEHVGKIIEQERKRLEPALREVGDNSVLDALDIVMTVAKDSLVDKVKRLKG